MLVQPEEWKNNLGFPFEHFIDLYPVDYLPKDKKEKRKYITMLMLFMYLRNTLACIAKHKEKKIPFQVQSSKLDAVDMKRYRSNLRKLEQELDTTFDTSKSEHELLTEIQEKLRVDTIATRIYTFSIN